MIYRTTLKTLSNGLPDNMKAPSFFDRMFLQAAFDNICVDLSPNVAFKSKYSQK